MTLFQSYRDLEADKIPILWIEVARLESKTPCSASQELKTTKPPLFPVWATTGYMYNFWHYWPLSTGTMPIARLHQSITILKIIRWPDGGVSSKYVCWKSSTCGLQFWLEGQIAPWMISVRGITNVATFIALTTTYTHALYTLTEWYLETEIKSFLLKEVHLFLPGCILVLQSRLQILIGTTKCILIIWWQFFVNITAMVSL